MTISHQGEVEQAAAAAAAAKTTTNKPWVVARGTEWRLAPNSSSATLGYLEAGRKVVQVPCARLSAIERAWCPIEPRGFVSFEDLVKAHEEPVQTVDSARSELEAREARLTIQEETVRLRENNVELKEQMVVAQSELDALVTTRTLVAKEVEEMRSTRAAEQTKLHSLEQKLLRCRDVIAMTVRTLDQVHGRELAAEGTSDKALVAKLASAGAAVKETLEEAQIYADVDDPRRSDFVETIAESVDHNDENSLEQPKVLSSSKATHLQPREPLRALNAIR